MSSYTTEYVKTNMLVATYGGSMAYSLSTETSDIDVRGVFFPNMESLLGTKKYNDHFEASKDDPFIFRDISTDDAVFHTVAKFANLIQRGNPTALEILFSDTFIYESEQWEKLSSLLRPFINARGVFSSYHGYLSNQKNRYSASCDAKAYSHCLRLSYHGINLLSTGNLQVALAGEQRDLCMRIKTGLVSKDDSICLVESASKELLRYDPEKTPSPLPLESRPDELSRAITEFMQDYITKGLCCIK